MKKQLSAIAIAIISTYCQSSIAKEATVEETIEWLNSIHISNDFFLFGQHSTETYSFTYPRSGILEVTKTTAWQNTSSRVTERLSIPMSRISDVKIYLDKVSINGHRFEDPITYVSTEEYQGRPPIIHKGKLPAVSLIVLDTDLRSRVHKALQHLHKLIGAESEPF